MSRVSLLFLAITVAGLAGGGVAAIAGADRMATGSWAAATLVALVPLGWETLRDLWRRQLGVDLIAIIALAGSLALGEYLAGAVIAVMWSTGGALEAYAGARAERELSSLLQRAPRLANRLRDGSVETVHVEEVRPRDRLVVREADVVPVDGVVTGGSAVLDESALTGESRPVTRSPGERVQSGVVNAGSPFEMLATATAEESAYSGIVRLVRQAQESRAPATRLADRYAALFIPVALVTAAGAWAISGDPVRGLAVAVVATPCPLLLAVPISVISGISRAARRGVIVKDGGSLEGLARGRILFLDKTGTLTAGTPEVIEVATADGVDADAMLADAAALDQLSTHVLAAALVRAARGRELELPVPEGVKEEAGGGISGRIGGRALLVGRPDWVSRQSGARVPEGIARRLRRHPGSAVLVAIDGCIAGAVLLDDPIRPEAARTIRGARRLGIDHVVMATGDHPRIAEFVGGALGVDTILAEASPEEKVDAVREATRRGFTLMVGDGINDAPALAAADIGVAMGARGASAPSEAADVVLVVDRLDRLPEAIAIAQRSRRIATESAVLGMGLSGVAMAAAALGFLPPVAGALLQEGIDALAIGNALRALSGGRAQRRPEVAPELFSEHRSEHARLAPQVERLRRAAEGVDQVAWPDARRELEAARGSLATLVEHERDDETQLYPRLREQMRGDDPLGSLSRSHQEIVHLSRVYSSLLDQLDPERPLQEDLFEIRRVLYGLHAVFRLHFAEEEDLFLSLSA